MTDYTNRGCKTLQQLELRLRLHLLPFFGRCRMFEIDTSLMRKYIAKRKADRRVARKARTKVYRRDGRRVEIPAVMKPYANATINRELEHVEACFALAVDDGRLTFKPTIPYLDESDNVRKGFLDPSQLVDVLGFLPACYQHVVRFAYMTGWRMHDEVLTLQWRQVDLVANEIRLDVGATKNKAGRVIAFGADLRALLLAQKASTEALQRQQDEMIPHVFHRDGEPIKSSTTRGGRHAGPLACPA
jgi:integrase